MIYLLYEKKVYIAKTSRFRRKITLIVGRISFKLNVFALDLMRSVVMF